MDNFIEPIAKLVNQFTRLPAVGAKTAQRYAFRVLNMTEAEAEAFAAAILEAKRKVKFCGVCGNFTDVDPCKICATRDHGVICVVKEARDILALEKARSHSGVYHVLGGVLSPMDGIGPAELAILPLVKRVKAGGVKEIIVATNPDAEGEVTALYIANLLRPLGVRVSRLAQGISIGSDLQYADEATLQLAIEHRVEI